MATRPERSVIVLRAVPHILQKPGSDFINGRIPALQVQWCIETLFRRTESIHQAYARRTPSVPDGTKAARQSLHTQGATGCRIGRELTVAWTQTSLGPQAPKVL